jgi:hypothetical protein
MAESERGEGLVAAVGILLYGIISSLHPTKSHSLIEASFVDQKLVPSHRGSRVFQSEKQT